MQATFKKANTVYVGSPSGFWLSLLPGRREAVGPFGNGMDQVTLKLPVSGHAGLYSLVCFYHVGGGLGETL